MSITDELREYANGWSDRGCYKRLIAIADRIDGQAEGEYARGYNAGFNAASAEVESADELRERIEREYVKMPCDADGAPIHIGDEMEGVDKYDSLKKVMGKVITVSFESDGIVDVAIRAWNSDGKSWHRAYLDPNASVYRHHHAPTVEDVLREFAECWDDPVHYAKGELVEQYAAKLRLAGESE